MTPPMSRAPLVSGIDKPLSALALGTAFFRADTRDHWHALLDAYAEQGGNMLDTAHAYGDSEPVIGSWLKARGNRHELVLCTKGGVGENLLPAHGLEQVVDAELAQSLERLGTDTVDLYWLHRDNPALPVGPIVECLNEQLRKGRIRAFGGSNWAYDRVDQANRYAAAHGLTGFAAVSNHLSLAVPTGPFYPGLVATDAAGRCWHARTGLPLFSWSSQARGFFTGRYSPEVVGDAESADGFTRRMLEIYGTEGNLERLRRAEQLGREKGGRSAVEVALAWVLGQGIPVVPIVGPRTREELLSCVGALAIKLSQEELRWLNLER
jgi:aryl-alcohol dehydrogenase-like predicted oxidoreductase